MKKNIILLIIGCVLLACKDQYSSSDEWCVRAHEEVTGVVTNEEGDPLQGILIKKYLDRDLSQEALNQKIYSNAEGKYRLSELSRYTSDMEFSEFFLSVTDPANVYKSQIILVQVRYCLLKYHNMVGKAEVNIVMTKK